MMCMNSFFKRAAAALSAAAVAGSNLAAAPLSGLTSDAAGSGMVLEYLDRGISAVNTGSGMLVSWRYLANDDDNAVYKLYRDGNLIYTSNAGDSTCFLDAGGSASSNYRVDTLSGGTIVGSETCKLISNNTYLDLPLEPPTASGVTYSPNDMSVGDVDGDGDIDTDDVNDILRHINGIEEIPEDRQPAADIDRDGEITKNDAELLQKYLDNKDKDSDRNSDTDSKDTDGKDSDNADTDTDDNDIGKPVNPYTGKDDTDTDNNGGNGGNSSDTDKNGGKDNNSDTDNNGGKDNNSDTDKNGGKDNNSDSDKNGGKDNNSDTDNSKDFEYEEDTDGSIIITGYTGTDEDVVIPNKIDDKPVKTIDDGAFKDNDGIKDITIPDSVENIADDAFDGHGDDLTIHGKPGSEAEKFADDNDIPFVPIGGENPDDNPGKIDTPDIPDTPDTPDSPDNPQREGFTYRVDPDGNAIITGYIGDAENLEIPEEIDGYPVKGIDDGAFKDKDGLKGMIIPKNVDSIGDDAFDGLGDDFTIYGYIGTEAEKHADEHNINFVPLAYLIGDVNADGKITAMDSLMVQRNTIALMKFTQAQTVRGDVDFNKRVTNRDALDILRYSIKLHTSSHVGEEITLEQLQSI